MKLSADVLLESTANFCQ